jgi:replicative DNA helicase
MSRMGDDDRGLALMEEAPLPVPDPWEQPHLRAAPGRGQRWIAQAAESLSAASRTQAPPNDIDAERSVLGAVFLHPPVITRVRAILDAGDFYYPSHGVIWTAMLAVADRGEPVDIVTVSAELRRGERINTIGGAQYLGDLTDAISTIAHAEAHAQLVADFARTRRIQSAAHEVYLRGWQRGNVDTYASNAVEAIATASRAKSGKGMVDTSAIACAIYEQIEAATSGRGVPRCTSGLVDLDRKVPLVGNKLIIVAARPAMGKTSLMLLMATETARTLGPTLIFTLEMTSAQLGQRYVAMRFGLPIAAVEEARLSQDQLETLARGLDAWVQLPIFVNPDEGMDLTAEAIVAQVEIKAEECARKSTPLAMVLIDYLQLVEHAEGAESTDKALSKITRTLKRMTRRLKIPVVVLAQLNRECEKRGDKRPMMSDLRDSGAIEQDADVVMFVYRDEVYNERSEDKGIAEIIVSKQRNGSIGKVRVAFNGERTLFSDLATDEPPPGLYQDDGRSIDDIPDF